MNNVKIIFSGGWDAYLAPACCGVVPLIIVLQLGDSCHSPCLFPDPRATSVSAFRIARGDRPLSKFAIRRPWATARANAVHEPSPQGGHGDARPSTRRRNVYCQNDKHAWCDLDFGYMNGAKNPRENSMPLPTP